MNTIDTIYHLNGQIKSSKLQFLFWGICNILFHVYFLVRPHRQPKSVDNNLIVSLTTFPKRIHYVYLSICSILSNSIQPQRVILWLSEQQFSSKNKLPYSLRRLEKYGLEIRFVPDDLKSHKKYYYAYQMFSNHLVLLVDDDLIYPSWFINSLMDTWQRAPKPCMVYNYGTLLYGKDGLWLSPAQRVQIYRSDDDTGSILAGSGGGVLLRPSDLKQIVLNKDVFMSLSPYGDDYWLNAIYRISGLHMIKTEGGHLLQVVIPRDTRLWSINKVEIDQTIQKINGYFSDNHNFIPFPSKLVL